MHIHCKYTGIRGFIRVYELGLKYRYMIQPKALHKARVVAFWEKHGLIATQDAFKLSRRTLYLWQAQFLRGDKTIQCLNEKSRRPHTLRKRTYPLTILNEIKRLRATHPNLGKAKLQPLLAGFCQSYNLAIPSVTTVGRLIKDMGGLRVYPRKIKTRARTAQVIRKPKDFKVKYLGECVALDTVVKHIWGQKRYIITFEDLHSRFGFAWATKSHASLVASEFFSVCQQVFPFPLKFVLTDNGSEFAKYFSQAIHNLNLIHYHTYPKTPKMNAHCERFNRTLQEEFIDYHMPELLEPSSFNQAMADYLIWYNTKRVHHAFNNKLTPVQFALQELSHNAQECKDGWTHTGI